MSGSPLSFAATFDGSTPSLQLQWVGANPQHIVLFSTSPVTGYANITPSLSAHSSLGAVLGVPPGWKGTIVVTLLQGMGMTWSAPIANFGFASFVATDTATVSWVKPFPDTTYKIQPGAITITDGLGPVAVVADNRTKTTAGVQLMADAAFTGVVDVVSYQPGAASLLVGP